MAIGLLSIALITGAGPVRGDVAQLDGWTMPNSSNPGGTAINVAVNGVTVSAGTDRLFVVAAVLESGTAGTVSNFNASLGGTALTPGPTTQAISGRETAKVWYLREASIPGAPANLVVTGTHTQNVTGLHIYRASFSGVDQTTPLAGSAANYNGGNAVTFGTAVNYVAGGLTFFATGNGGMAATLTGPAAFTQRLATTSDGHTSFTADTGVHAASGTYAGGTNVTFGGTTSNRSAVAVVSLRTSYLCASPGSAGPGGTLSGVVNAYWPGTASVAAGATAVTVGARTGAASSLVAGDLVLVIQMQDASVDSTNTNAYGDGAAGEPASGSTALNSAGLYEFATVTSTGGGWTAAGGGTINLASTGTGGGLLNAYNNADASGTQGQRRFQVVRVPQYSTATLGSATALPWSTSTAAPIGLGTGGVLVVDVAGDLTITGTTCDVSGRGFRGGGGRQLGGGGGANTDIRTSSAVNTNASKGEGIAGTPEWIAGPSGPVTTSQPNDGYPNGSYARGAPGNAGGGSTDGNPGANDQNSGGGGGGNGGRGARGGNSWNSNLAVGGSGGAGYGASATRLLMGGGGGAGTRNNSPCDPLASGGAPGGGIVFLRAGQIVGTGTIRANGSDAYNDTANDSGGGGGAGGTIVLVANTGALANVTAEVHGGRGGDAWARVNCSATVGTTLGDRHGPGGGGGGGVVVSSSAVGTIDVAGGQSGLTTTLNDGFGTEPGASGGTSSIVISISVIPGVGGGIACACDPAIAITHTPNGGSVGGNLSSNSSGYFTATVTNVAPYLPTSGTLTVTFTVPAGLTPVASAAGQTLGGTGWTGCTIVGQTVSCQRSDSVAPGAAYPPMIVPFTTGTGPALFTTSAVLSVSGGTDANYNLANDTASDSAVLLSPTVARMGEVRIVSGPGRTSVSWRTSFEVANLGFRVWREDGGVRVERTSELLAGSALFAGQNVTLTAGRHYRFVDPVPAGAGTAWWIEEIDLSGSKVWHGPFHAETGAGAEANAPVSPPLSLLSEARPARRSNPGLGAERHQPLTLVAAVVPAVPQSVLAGSPAAKLAVSREGWYRVTKTEIVAAGFDPGSDPVRLSLYAEGVEQAIVVDDGGDGTFDAADAIRFYAYGLDTPSTDRRVYWLVRGQAAGLRALVAAAPASGGQAVGGFPYTSLYEERVLYIAALTSLSGHDNFFGPVVSSEGTTIGIPSPNRVPGESATLVVKLQGTTFQGHSVDVLLGGRRLGTVTSTGREAPQATFPVLAGDLGDVSTVSLRSLGGSMDYSVIDFLRLEYAHRYRTDDDALAFSAPPGGSIAIGGFSSASIQVVDVSDPDRPIFLTPVVEQDADGFTATVRVPSDGGRRILAVAASRIRTPAAIEANAPSSLLERKGGAAFVVIAHPSLLSAAAPLAKRRGSEGLVTAVIDVTDVYDEFSFGAKDPGAIRSFLRAAAENAWTLKPRYVLLLGDASFDPRDYLGFGNYDLVPTNAIPTRYLMTASDDVFADINKSGLPAMAVGRMPARTPAEATLMVGKALARGAAAPNASVLIASDVPGDYDFRAAAVQLAALVPRSFSVQLLDGAAPPGGDMHGALIRAFNAGPSLATWVGHGSEATLGKQTFFDGSDALALTNQKPSVFLAADCLNGYFHDVYGDSLAESLLKAQAGGAAAVWASSALTEPVDQMLMMSSFYAYIYGGTVAPRLGDAVVKARRATTDLDVRRSWILFGDPTMPMKPAP